MFFVESRVTHRNVPQVNRDMFRSVTRIDICVVDPDQYDWCVRLVVTNSTYPETFACFENVTGQLESVESRALEQSWGIKTHWGDPESKVFGTLPSHLS